MFTRELRAFRRMLPHLTDREGWFGIFKDDGLVGLAATQEAAMSFAHSLYPQGGFMVKRIEQEHLVQPHPRIKRECPA